jgi:hypothetical protein
MPSVQELTTAVQERTTAVQERAVETELICILCNESSPSVTREHSCSLRNVENEDIIIGTIKRNNTI